MAKTIWQNYDFCPFLGRKLGATKVLGMYVNERNKNSFIKIEKWIQVYSHQLSRDNEDYMGVECKYSEFEK